MEAALLDPPKVLKGNPGVLVSAIPEPAPPQLYTQIKVMKAAWTGTPGEVISTVTAADLQMAQRYVSGPSSEALAAAKERALNWVNALRTEWGFPALEQLPKGHPRSRFDCAIARALPHATSVSSTVRLRSGYVMNVPMEARAFICYFDAGYYPELVA